MDNYVRAFELIRVVNGDTIEGYVDWGCSRYDVMRFRLSGVVAPSLRSRDNKEKEAAKTAKMWLQQRLMKHRLFIQIQKTNKFDKYLAVVFADGCNVNEEMLKAGHVVKFEKMKHAPQDQEEGD